MLYLTYDRKQDEFRLDVLKELGNIGAGHATHRTIKTTWQQEAYPRGASGH